MTCVRSKISDKETEILPTWNLWIQPTVGWKLITRLISRRNRSLVTPRILFYFFVATFSAQSVLYRALSMRFFTQSSWLQSAAIVETSKCKVATSIDALEGHMIFSKQSSTIYQTDCEKSFTVSSFLLRVIHAIQCTVYANLRTNI